MIYSVRFVYKYTQKIIFTLEEKKLKETGLPNSPKNQENKASHSSTDLEGKCF